MTVINLKRYQRSGPGVLCHKKNLLRTCGVKVESVPDECDTKICTICREYNEKLCLDHCHTSLEFRGWICSGCNSGLGFFKDDVERLSQAINYLNKFSTKK